MSTIFKRLRAKNALSFQQADMPLENQGLVLLRGENLDEGGSNGAGKSTLFELLYNLFFDRLTKTDRRIKKSDLLNSQNPRDFLVRSDISVDGIDYQIDKFRSHYKYGTGTKVVRAGVNITPDDPREAQKLISSLTGLTANEFLGRVYLSQRHTHMMIDGTPAQKRDYLSRCFGWDSLDVMVKETTKRMNGISLPDESHLKEMLLSVEQDLKVLGDLSEVSSQLEDCSKKQSELQMRLVDLKVEMEKQESAKSCAEARRVWASTVEELGLEFESSAIKSALHKSKKSVVLYTELVSTARKRKSLEEKLALEGEAPVDVDDSRLEDINKKLSRLERDLPGVERWHKLSAKLQGLPVDSDSTDVLESRTEKWKLKLSDVQAKLSSVQSEISKLNGVGDVCYTCSRPISAHDKEEMILERVTSVSKLKELVAKAKEAVDHYSSRLLIAQKRTEILLQLEDLPAGDVSDLQSTIDSLRIEQRTLQKLESKLARIRLLQEQLLELKESNKTLEDLESSLTRHESRLATLESAYNWILQFGDVRFDPHSLQRVQGAVASYSKQLEEVNSTQLSLQDKSTRYSSLKKQQDDLVKTLSKVSAEKQRHQVLRYLNVTIEELKKVSLRESTQLLSTVLPLYLDQMFPDGDIQLSVTDDAEGFDLMFNKGGKSIPLTLISGGQAKRVGIAIVFSFAKLGRNTTNLLICDEPFRDLDPKGREACFELLRDFDMGTVLVTSHDQDTNAPKKYDRVWTVRMLNHTSRLYLDG